jgi:hypothetical protein
MMAADVAEAAIDPVPDEMVSYETVATESTDPIAGDEWQAHELVMCGLQLYEVADPMPVVDPVIIDDSSLMIDDASLMVYEPVDIRVQFVSSETEPGWAAYSYTVGAYGVVQSVSVVASYDEPTIAAFAGEHADDPAVQISDYGDGWWIGSFPLVFAPPVPEYGVFYRGDGTSSEQSFASETSEVTESVDGGSDWSWDGSTDAGVERTWDTSDEAFTDWSGSWYVGSWDDSGEVYAVDGSGPIYFCGGSWDDWNSGSYDGGGYGGDGTVMPLFYARRVEPSDPFAQDAFDKYSLPNDTGAAAAPVEEHDVAVPVPATASPRSAAFADMGTMAAAATAMQASSAEAVVIGGGRRRR